MIQIKIEGQTLELPPEIAVSDDAIRRAVAPVFPQVANAHFTRTEDSEGHTVIKVTKQAGTKGSLQTVLAHLKDCPRHVNPVFPLYQRLHHDKRVIPTAEEFFSILGQLDSAIDNGRAEIRDTTRILRQLVAAPGHASTQTPLGF
jgi:hypothetical protein